MLEEVLKLGFCTIGELNYETAAYCARYCCKKVTGHKAYSHYVTDDGDMIEPEFGLMSRRPGVGRGWYDLWGDEVFPDDEVFLRGAILKPPRYYEVMFGLEDPEGLDEVKRKRNEYFVKHAADCTPQRLKDRECVKRAQVGQLKRSFEEYGDGA